MRICNSIISKTDGRTQPAFDKLKVQLYRSLKRRFVRRQIDSTILEMALVGLKARRDEVIRKMADIERQLGGHRKVASAPAAAADTSTAAAKPKRKLSAAGKRAILAALKRRWAAFHAKIGAVKASKPGAKKTKRTMAPAVKATLAANLAIARAVKANKRVKH